VQELLIIEKNCQQKSTKKNLVKKKAIGASSLVLLQESCEIS
jgi:hypothetical protein